MISGGQIAFIEVANLLLFQVRMVDMNEIDMAWEFLANEDYRFIHDNPILGENVILLTFGGSHAYGTNVEESDIDIRGITFNPVGSLLGNEEFEQFEDHNTDTVIYGLNKMFKLLLQCNPNTIELLGCKPEHYFELSKAGEMLLQNKKIFLSKRAIYTFGGYANSQLRRLQNALARDSYPQEEKEKHILGSIHSAMDAIVNRYHKINGEPIKYNFSNDNGNLVHAYKEYNEKMQYMENFKSFEYGGINLYPDISDREEMNVEIFCDVVLHHYPLRDYRNIWSELNTIVKDYDKLGKRNNKKDDKHLNKHAMHLIRLYVMCLDILEKEQIITYRTEEHDLLMSIRNGDFQKDDHTYRPEFFELVDEYEKRLKYASENTSLPENPDYKAAKELLIEMNEEHIKDQMLNH